MLVLIWLTSVNNRTKRKKREISPRELRDRFNRTHPRMPWSGGKSKSIELGPGPTVLINKRGSTPGLVTYHFSTTHRSIRALEGSEARAPPPGQCRWRPEGRRYPERMLKERLCYIPDVVHSIDDVTTASTPTSAMDATTAGIWTEHFDSALVNVLGMIYFGLEILVSQVCSKLC